MPLLSTGSNTAKSSSAAPSGSPIFVDLAYIPNHCSAKNVDQEFFKRVRSAYYVVSGNDSSSGEPSRGVLDALLEGKAHWGSNLQVELLIHLHKSQFVKANNKIVPNANKVMTVRNVLPNPSFKRLHGHWTCCVICVLLISFEKTCMINNANSSWSLEDNK